MCRASGSEKSERVEGQAVLGRAGSLGKGRQSWEGQAVLGRAGSLGKGNR